MQHLLRALLIYAISLFGLSLSKAETIRPRIHYNSTNSQTFSNLQWAAVAGNAEAQYQYGLFFAERSLVTSEFEDQYKWFYAAAQKGHVKAESELALCFYEGHGVEKNENKAFKWWLKSAQGFDATAMYNVGLCYEYGEGVTQDKEKAESWFHKAEINGFKSRNEPQKSETINVNSIDSILTKAQKGDPKAQVSIGLAYFNGDTVETNYVVAVKWFSEAAASEDPVGECNLGIAYDNGYGVEKNEAKALEWYVKSALHGYSKSQYYLGKSYLDGYLINKNPDMAFFWLQKSALQSDPQGEFALGICYETATGRERNCAIALDWYRKAAEHGNTNAIAKVHNFKQTIGAVRKAFDEANALSLGTSQRLNQLKNVLDLSEPILKDYPDLLTLWLARGAVAIELDLAQVGWESGNQVRRLQNGTQAKPATISFLKYIEDKGWAGDKPPQLLPIEEQKPARRVEALSHRDKILLVFSSIQTSKFGQAIGLENVKMFCAVVAIVALIIVSCVLPRNQIINEEILEFPF